MSETVTVLIANFAYAPAEVELRINQPIIWHNSDGMAHTATRVAIPSFDTGKILPGESSDPLFFDSVTAEEGIEYFCKPHPFMRGRIIVR